MRTLVWSLLLVPCLTLGLAVGPGCAPQVRPTAPSPGLQSEAKSEAEADSQSGPDGVQPGAVQLKVSRSLEDDIPLQIFEGEGEVSWPAHQRTRWRRLLIDEQGMDADTPLRCELRYQPQAADVRLDAWMNPPKRLPTPTEESAQPPKQLPMQLPDHHQSSPGLYVAELFFERLGEIFLRIRAERPQDHARFTVRCTWHHTLFHDEPYRGHGGVPRPRGRQVEAPDIFERGTEGRIVSSERKDGKQVIRIDKGTVAGIKVGSTGHVLEGKSGRSPLDGGDFQVIEVTETECVAESKARSLGRNRRVVFFSK